MFDILSLKPEADRLMAIQGTNKGSMIITIEKYVKLRLGDEAVLQIERYLKDLGYPLEFKSIKGMSNYPESQGILILLICQKALNFTNEDIFNFGCFATKSSFLDRLIIGFFGSLKLLVKNAPKYWKRYISVGDLVIKEYNEDKKYLIAHLKNYVFHPVACLAAAGHFVGLLRFIKPQAAVKETKCCHKGDSFHEFLFTWE